MRGWAILFVVYVTALLVACGTMPPMPPTCPSLASYTPAEQVAAADELAKLPPGSVLGQMVVDYGALRAQVRACRS